jgi:large subunit ribosomal protein L24
MNKLRSGDEIIVIAGRDKGKRGKITSRKDETHLVVEGINLVKTHQTQSDEKHHGRYC